jgi:hypothetical protein
MVFWLGFGPGFCGATTAQSIVRQSRGTPPNRGVAQFWRGGGWLARIVQKLERVFSSRFTIVEIEHSAQAFAISYGFIG